ncbi:RNA-binding domain-containing protein [Sunxiuqinia elliptica]|uniref:ATP-dependent DNA helicase RecG n=1 Tax=Sunxiuqinia elliptica TaxID=655355 RepID=A0A4R6HAL2_9BACT|nr:RNA-binding domain-containing protein [Sunxiuqinia elliptica]TDO05400.1 ATP-dependent DNA helicase RecG [Sunxiuqinia elliptica]TDO64947.1 ATP-dependent DNA helicase RecG [Sunxiuqinia elliptica]
MSVIGLNKEKVQAMLVDLESEQIERTTSTTDTSKFAQAICAFSNDLSNTAKNGYLFIGVYDNGTLSGLKVSDRLLQSLGGLRSDGNILPQPIMSVSVFSFVHGDVIVIEIQPSPFPPVRYKGKTWIRVGPRKAVANDMEERILIERRASNVSTFDVRPSLGLGLDSINQKLFTENYLPQAIDNDLLADDHRELAEKLASLRFFSPNYSAITNAGLLLFGNEVERYIPGAYIQYVKFDGLTEADDPINEKKFSGNLVHILSELDSFLEYAIVQQKPVPVTALKEKKQFNFPKWAIRELLMNSVMHRDYESNAPIKFYQYKDRIEIINPGGLYGNARPENFPNVNDYRNPVIAEAMKVLGYVNRFNRGIARVKKELADNKNPEAVFDYEKIGVFGVTVYDALYESRKNLHAETGKLRITPGKVTFNVSMKNPEKVLMLIEQNMHITIPEMADKIGISVKGVEKIVSILKKEDRIERVGSRKTGYWLVKK